MNCRSKLICVLFQQNKISLPFNEPLRRIQSNVIFYNSFQSGRKTGQATVNKARRRDRRNLTFGKDKFITRLNMRPKFSNQSTLLNTLQMGLNNVRLCLEECSLSRSENYKFNGVVSIRRNNTL